MTMHRRTIAGRLRVSGSGILISIPLVFLFTRSINKATAKMTEHPIQRFAGCPPFAEFSDKFGRVVSSLVKGTMRLKSREDSQPRAWKTVPRWTIVVFLLAAFFIFASFGLIFDGMDMGRQPALCLAFSVVIIAIFAMCYTVAGITLRQRFWIPSVPLFILENICLARLHNWLPDAPPLAHPDSSQLSSFHNRLIFDGSAGILANRDALCLSEWMARRWHSA
jgi:hypothetical protein